ncbi:Inositol 2-dehydrogenase/D-chiro-inositol 3-dehydrogenase (plasmid) [Sphingobium sp. AntQ-1]|uniref:bi-domain-containing oxidoreductase n=1 Tax=Sphingobium sp. AntQ-1 TaxID=2930091 RepID=UPI00234FA3E6|nr:bi-domain-containing oxidoreductase [Sphingobium sp. AntQ-1]WCP16211.1 Inositol 2-dehydrogenase/D-chiro-inositol 3-dehydrogenase [Sphingobium sp. AntQ-1]
MKQILQDLSAGRTELVDCPAPTSRRGQLLIDTAVSLISSGTERMLVDFGRAGLVAKARQQPEKVAQVLDKVRTDGLLTTMEAVRSKLGQPIPLGYCNVGVVREAGAGVNGFQPGERVVSNGPHADVVSVPVNLCARIPDGVSDEEAAFTVVAAIGLQGIRLASPTLGEAFVVTGAGLIGLLTIQLLRAQGCRVLAIDFDEAKLAIARGFGADTCNPAKGEDPIAAGIAFSRGAGVDGVIITASTKSSDPVTQAARMCRKRGRIVLVGVTGLDLNRADFYEKELSFQVSCSYGPGRYDPAYEDQGQDYPIGFVRWTEQRNFEAVLDLMASGQMDVRPLISHRFPFEDAPAAYERLASDKGSLGILLGYQHAVEERHKRTVELHPTVTTIAPSAPVVGFIGAGNYAGRMLIPAFRKAGATLHSIASAGGVSSVVQGKRLGFTNATSDTAGLLNEPAINTVAIATRHDSHAKLTIDALHAGKHIFVEKPLALNLEELEAVKKAHASANRLVMVGFNRRFAPLVQAMKRQLDPVREPKSIIMVMNAGAIPADHWTQDQTTGGGRIIGEACHHIDLMRFLVGAPIVSMSARRMGDNHAVEITEDKAVLTLGFADGSFGTIHYLANGGASFPKERVEIFTAGRTLQLDNFLRLRGYNWRGFRNQKSWRQDKGQEACAAAFLSAISNGGPAPIPFDELEEVARITIEAADMLRAQR